MTQEKIDRINALARKAKAEGLTEEEAAEQAALRREYIESVTGNLRSQLDHTVIQHPNGTRTPLKKKPLS